MREQPYKRHCVCSVFFFENTTPHNSCSRILLVFFVNCEQGNKSFKISMHKTLSKTEKYISEFLITCQSTVIWISQSSLPRIQYITKQQEKATRKMFNKLVTYNLFTKQLTRLLFTKWVYWIFYFGNIILVKWWLRPYYKGLNKAALHRPPRSSWIKDTIRIQWVWMWKQFLVFNSWQGKKHCCQVRRGPAVTPPHKQTHIPKL